ncbi:MAG: rRNA adenine N-6-methyltransferase family protein [Bacteroidota bacterium]
MLKKILSYIYPVSKKILTDHNATLEITWYNGRKMLDSANTNYSYGSLQKILKFGLQQIDLSEVNHILLLGMGGGSVIQTLRNYFHYDKKITAVEIDSAVIKIAKNEFNITENDQLKIVHADAIDFIDHCKKKFQLIIVDLFIDADVPVAFHSQEPWMKLKELIDINGYILFNASLSDGVLPITATLPEWLKSDFTFNTFNNVAGSNTILVGKRVA